MQNDIDFLLYAGREILECGLVYLFLWGIPAMVVCGIPCVLIQHEAYSCAVSYCTILFVVGFSLSRLFADSDGNKAEVDEE